jgi:small subunit ribosomal protein S2
LPDTATIKQLLEAGAHFGHQTSRWNPRMKSYIFTKRNGIHIIDLEQTVVMLDKACNFIQQVAAEGGTILFVGTKKQAQESIEEEARRCGMYYVNQRWLGGVLTNFATIQARIDYLVRSEDQQTRGDFNCSKVADSIIEGRTGITAILTEEAPEEGLEELEAKEVAEPLIFTPDDA